MNEPIEQSYANHVRRLPRLYLLACIVIAIYILWSFYVLYDKPSIDRSLRILAWIGVGILAYYARHNAQIVQDRLIRLEERLRLERLLPADLKARIPELTVAQLVALRFASDDELAELVRQVLDEKLVHRKQIKERIRRWRGDLFRV